MSVGFNFRVDTRPYSAYEDPSLPIAAWIGQAGAVGNATGGILTMDFLFQDDDENLRSEMFNLEQISMDTTVTATRDVELATLSMDNLSPARPGSSQRWHLESTAVGGVSGSAYKLLSNMLPVWLGAPNREEGSSGIRFSWQNIDLQLYAVTVQGYMWGPRSVLAPGGPQRPVNGLFGP